MLKCLIAALLLLMASLPVAAQHSSAGTTQTLTLTGSAQNLPSVPATAVMAAVCIEAANARWRDDNTDPTATVGQPLLAGQCILLNGPLPAVRMIAQSGSPVATISYYR